MIKRTRKGAPGSLIRQRTIAPIVGAPVRAGGRATRQAVGLLAVPSEAQVANRRVVRAAGRRAAVVDARAPVPRGLAVDSDPRVPREGGVASGV